MNHRNLVSALIFTGVLLLPTSVTAITVDQFFGVCETDQLECAQHPLVNAYVGGALDLIAVLDEETEYLDTVYCKSPTELFDVPAIIQYMQLHRAEHASQNAMILVLRYLEENGDC